MRRRCIVCGWMKMVCWRGCRVDACSLQRRGDLLTEGQDRDGNRLRRRSACDEGPWSSLPYKATVQRLPNNTKLKIIYGSRRVHARQEGAMPRFDTSALIAAVAIAETGQAGRQHGKSFLDFAGFSSCNSHPAVISYQSFNTVINHLVACTFPSSSASSLVLHTLAYWISPATRSVYFSCIYFLSIVNIPPYRVFASH